jgi:hypothetical protein
MSQRVSRFCVAAALAGLACCLPIGATEEEPPTPMEQMNKALFTIQQHITASNVKLNRRLTGASPNIPEERPPTVAESCCLPHIDRITNKVRQMLQIMEQLGQWYAEQDHAEARVALGEIHNDLINVARGMAVFKMAGSRVRAKEALQGLIAPFNRLRTAVEELEACCPLEQAADGSWQATAPAPTS